MGHKIAGCTVLATLLAKEDAMRILLAVDESENSHRAVKCVGSLLRRTPEVAVTLFHVLTPMPRGLLAPGGRASPAVEAHRDPTLRRDEAHMIRNARESAAHVL